MSNQFFNFIHVTPLLFITIVSIVYLYCKTFTQVKFNLMPIVLILSSFGIASRYLIHHSHAESVGSCYACVGYALIVAACAVKIHFSGRDQVFKESL